MDSVHERRGASSPLEVFIKFKCGASPAVTRFLVLVYADAYQHRTLSALLGCSSPAPPRAEPNPLSHLSACCPAF